MKIPLSISTSCLIAITASAAVPVRWTVETSRVQPTQIEAYHGETLRFEAALQSYGRPFAPTNNLVAIYWQTNGMDSAYWVGPAVISNHVLLAEWVPAMDVGATVYQGFIGAAGEIYRAAFQLRLRPSPGAVPSELPLPVRAIDFAQVEVRNAPYYTQAETDAKIIELAPAPGNYETVSNRAMNAVQPAAISDMETQTHAAANYAAKSSLQDKFDKSGGNMYGTLNLVDGSSLLFDGEDWTSVFDRIVSQYVWDWSSIYNTPTTLSGYGIEDAYIQNGTITLGSQSITPLTSYTETDPTVPTWAKTPSKPTYNWSEIGSKPSWIGSSKPSYTWSEIGSRPTIPTDSTVAGWGYIKSYTETDPTVPSWAKATSKPSYTWTEIGSKPSWIGSTKPSYTWNEITSKPTTFTPSAHSHASDSWFTDALASKRDMTDRKNYPETEQVLASRLPVVLNDNNFTNVRVVPEQHPMLEGAKYAVLGDVPEYQDIIIAELDSDGKYLGGPGATFGGVVPTAGMQIACGGATGVSDGDTLALTSDIPTSMAWSAITGKPSWIGASKPTYTWTEVTGLADKLDGKLDKTGGIMTGPIAVVGSDVQEVLTIDGMYLRVTNGEYNAQFTLPASGGGGPLATQNDIPTALKCPNALTINVNGALAATYDGSAAKTVNISTGGSGPGGTVASATLAYHADGQAIAVSVAAAGTFSATLTDWPDGQSQMAFVTLAAGATVSPAIKLIGYSDWTTGEEFMAVATRRNNKIYLNPVCITEE